MRNILLIIFGVLLIVIVIFVRLNFHKEFEDFKQEIKAYESTLSNALTSEKLIRLNLLQKTNSKVVNKFNSQFSLDSSIIRRDTVFRYFYLKKVVPYDLYSSNYIECLVKKCELEIEQEDVFNEINKQKERLLKKYGETNFNYWFNTLKDNKLMISESLQPGCREFFKDFQIIKFDNTIWNSFEALLRDYNYEVQNIKDQNDRERQEIEKSIRNVRRQLYGNALDYFNTSINQNKSSLLEEKKIEKNFQTEALGNIDYTLTKETFRKETFDKLADSAFEIQWSTNSLSNGAMPYANCYGASNICFDYECSEINVKNGGTDVVVIIKTTSDNVIRHAYIKAGYKFVFHIPNGTYNIYFYSGVGWNPNKVMSTSYCNIKGGFVSSENTGKDTYVNVSNQILSYTLQQVVNGNFSMESSSKSEAFN